MELTVPPTGGREWRSGLRVCRCCLSERCYRDIRTEYDWMGQKEKYANMLKECFDIAISLEGAADSDRLICEVCVTRLRDATNFKQQVVHSQQHLANYFRSESILDDSLALKYAVHKKGAPRESSCGDETLCPSGVDMTTTGWVSAGSGDESRTNQLESIEMEVTAEPEKGIAGGGGGSGKAKKAPPGSRTHKRSMSAAKKDIPVKVAQRVTCQNAAVFKPEPIDFSNDNANDQACVHGNDDFSGVEHCGSPMRNKLTEVFIKIEPGSEDESAAEMGSPDAATIKQELDIDVTSLQPPDATPLSVEHRRGQNSAGAQRTLKVLKNRSTNKETAIKQAMVETEHDERLYWCNYCSRRFRQRSHLLNHLNVHTVERLYSCDICSKRFIRKGHLKIHAMIHTNERPYSCEVCSKRFMQRYKLTNHLKIHTTKLPYSCDVCDKCFMHRYNLTNHLRIHNNDRPYSCKICSKRFTLNSILVGHLQTHAPERPYSCNVCSKRFIRKGHLVVHAKIHTNERPHSCKICNKSFLQKHKLTKHLKIHANTLSYNCNACGKIFAHRHRLTNHLKTHNVKLPYICDVCSRRFTRKDILANHMKTHTGERPYSCHICCKRFTRKDRLTIHHKIHSNDRPYSCNVCKKSFPERSKLTHHLKIHAGECQGQQVK